MSFIDRMRALFKSFQQQSSSGLLLKDISQQMQTLNDSLQEKIEAAASGQQGKADATVEYIIKDRTGGELQTEWQDTDYVTYDDIISSPEYMALLKSTQDIGVKLKLIEEQIEEVDDEERVRFRLVFSGWGN